MADEVVASGKSREEIAYKLASDLLHACIDSPKQITRKEILEHYLMARSVVWGNGSLKGLDDRNS